MMPLTLAAGWEQLIVVAIFATIFIVKAIAKGTSNANGQGKSGSSASGASAQSQRAARLEELARKRRAELQQLAAQRQQSGQQHPTTTPSQQQPGNITAQQAGQRQQAKTLYERRAEALRQMQRQQQPQPRQAPPSRPAPIKQQQPREFARQTQPGDPTQHELSQVRQREEQLERQRQLAARQREEQLRKQAQQLGSGATEVSHSRHGEVETVHRHIDDVKAEPKQHQSHPIAALGGMTLNRQSLRQAIILKEILDPPLALRKVSSE